MTAPRWLTTLAALATVGCAATPADEIPAGAAASLAPLQAQNWRAQRVHYDCDSGRHLAVQYLSLTDGPAFAALHYGGTIHLLQRRPTASGSRYIAVDEQFSLRWHIRGPQGVLAFLAADHTASEQTLATCRRSA